MKLLRPFKKSEEEEESVFVPITDMTVSFLFIMIILVAFFAVSANMEEESIALSVHNEMIERKDEEILKRDKVIAEQKIEIIDLEEKLKALKIELDNSEKLVKNLEAKLLNAKNEIESQKSVISGQNSLIARQISEIDSLEVELKKIEKANKKLEKDLEIALREIDKKKRLISKKNKEIKKLADLNNELSKELKASQELTKQLRKDLEAAQKEINKRDKLIAKQKVEIKRLEDEIIRLNKLLKVNPLEDYISKSQSRRLEILKSIEAQLRLDFKEDILVEVSPENDALRFKGDGLFASGSAKLIGVKRRIVSSLSKYLIEEIQCFTVNEIQQELGYKECNPEGIVIEAVQIEGHTDSDGSNINNINLSTARSNAAYFIMERRIINLLAFKNIRGQPVVSVAGYGENRPIAPNITIKQKAENRRIDLRLIMFIPKNRDQVNELQDRVETGLSLAFERK